MSAIQHHAKLYSAIEVLLDTAASSILAVQAARSWANSYLYTVLARDVCMENARTGCALWSA